MPRTGNYFDVVLQPAHLNWETESRSNTPRNRNEYELYIPIRIVNARAYNIRKGEIFNCSSDDGYFEGPLKATGSQGPSKEYGKNFYKDGDLRTLGYWLKDRRHVNVGDIIRGRAYNKIISFSVDCLNDLVIN